MKVRVTFEVEQFPDPLTQTEATADESAKRIAADLKSRVGDDASVVEITRANVYYETVDFKPEEVLNGIPF